MFELHWFQAWEVKLLDADRRNYRRYRFIRPLAAPTIEHAIAVEDAEGAKAGLDPRKKTRTKVRRIWPHDEKEELNKGAK